MFRIIEAHQGHFRLCFYLSSCSIVLLDVINVKNIYWISVSGKQLCGLVFGKKGWYKTFSLDLRPWLATFYGLSKLASDVRFSSYSREIRKFNAAYPLQSCLTLLRSRQHQTELESGMQMQKDSRLNRSTLSIIRLSVGLTNWTILFWLWCSCDNLALLYSMKARMLPKGEFCFTSVALVGLKWIDL